MVEMAEQQTAGAAGSSSCSSLAAVNLPRLAAVKLPRPAAAAAAEVAAVDTSSSWYSVYKKYVFKYMLSFC